MSPSTSVPSTLRARHRLLRGVTVALLALALTAPGTAAQGAPTAASGLTIGSLRVDWAENPVGIDDSTPSLSWQLTSGQNNQRQSAFQVLVATRPQLLHPGRADVWDSGQKAGDTSVAVPYRGPALRSAQRYYWTVRTWDAHGRVSGFAPSAFWETGLLRAADWHGAQWIAPDTAGRDSWSDFDLDVDFTIVKGAASVLLRARDASNLYLWQINTAVNPGRVMLRPHVEVNGSFNHLVPDVDVTDALDPADPAQPHHLRVRADGATFTTWIDGTQVNQLTDATFATGSIGFRIGDSSEDALYDNLQLHGLDGSTLLSDDFSANPDPNFPGTPVADGQLHPGGGITLLDDNPTAPMLRSSLALTGTVRSARAYVSGLGFYELHVNGRVIGNDRLAPGSTPYAQRTLYQTYDVTSALRRGANAVGIWLGRGYGPGFSPYGFRWLGPEQAIGLITVTYTDGRRQDFATGPNGWSWASGPIVANDLYSGESYDARIDRSGWDQPGYDAASWSPVTAVAAPGPNLVASAMPMVHVVQTLRAVRVTQPQPGVFVYDFGQNLAGWERLQVAGPRGTAVRMQTAEDLGDDGTLDTTTNRNAASTDEYVLAGTGTTETYEPRFTYHGFRYLQVTGFPGTPGPASIVAQVAHADVSSTGTFDSSDELLNTIWDNNRRTMLNNSMSTPTDNPVRDERTPPGMDVQAYHDASTREFDMDRYYLNYLQDMPPGVALPNDAGNAQNPDMGGDQISLAWTLYQQYGDKPTLAAFYPQMKTFVDTNAAVPGHIWPADHGFGDWCPPVYGDGVNGGLGSPGIGSCTSEVSIVNTALSYLQAHDVALAAAALGHRDDAAHYAALAADIKNAFNATFLNAAHDTYGDGRQTTSILPLAFGMVPSEYVRSVGSQLVHTILVTDSGHLDTGIFGTRYLMDALAVIGRTDVAMTVLDQTTYPGYGYEIGQGATTDWEQWTYRSGMESHDHAMFSGINASLYTALAGIEPTGAGYSTVRIAPQVPPTLHRVTASIDTVRGIVSSSWQTVGGTVTLDVAVPVGTTATIVVPLPRAGARVKAPSGAAPGRVTASTAQYTVGSGSWHFTAS